MLPVTVDAVMAWDAIPADYDADMLADGIVLESPSDMAKCWPEVWETTEAARLWQRRTTTGQNSIGTTSGQNPMENREMTACPFRYRHLVECQMWRRGVFDPVVMPDPRT